MEEEYRPWLDWAGGQLPTLQAPEAPQIDYPGPQDTHPHGRGLFDLGGARSQALILSGSRTALRRRTYQHLTRGGRVLPALTSNGAGKLLAIRRANFLSMMSYVVYWGEQMAPSADALADAVRIEQVEEVFNGAVSSTEV